MDFDSYLYEARKTAIYPRSEAIPYLVLGLCSEAGEVAGKFKKLIRDEVEVEVTNELGDVLWYLAMLIDESDLTFDEVARVNLEKLRDRQERGVISGSGDDR